MMPESKTKVLYCRQSPACCGAIVDAGSVVTKDAEDYAIVAGTPAKLIGQRT